MKKPLIDIATCFSYQQSIDKQKFREKKLTIKNINNYGAETKRGLNALNKLFSYIILTKYPEYKKYLPYKINVFNLVPKNKYTQGTYVAINKDNGELDLYLAFEKIKTDIKIFPVFLLTWVVCHEFRHKIQLHDENIKSVINYPNWKTFNEYMQRKHSKSEDFINHIFHELNPAEVDANVFASQATGIKFNGNAFNITEEQLKSLEK